MGGGGASRARIRTRSPLPKPAGASSESMLTRTRGGRLGSAGTNVSRMVSFAIRRSTRSTLASKPATSGRLIRGAATCSDLPQTRAQPSAIPTANQPSERPVRPRPNTKRQDRARLPCTGPPPTAAVARARTRLQCRIRSRPRTKAEAVRAPPRAAFQAAPPLRVPTPSKSSEHAVEEALPLC